MVIDYAKRCEKNMLISTVLTLVLGLILVFKPGSLLKVITGIIAAIIAVIGILQILDYFRKSKEEKMMSVSLILGIVFCGIGAFLFFNLESLVNFCTTLIGMLLVIKALFKLQFSFNIKGVSNKWVYNLIVGICVLVLGVILLFNPYKSAEVFLRIIGGFIVVESILEIIETFIIMKNLDDAKELDFVEKK